MSDDKTKHTADDVDDMAGADARNTADMHDDAPETIAYTIDYGDDDADVGAIAGIDDDARVADGADGADATADDNTTADAVGELAADLDMSTTDDDDIGNESGTGNANGADDATDDATTLSSTLDRSIRHGVHDADDAVFRSYPMLACDHVTVDDRKTGEHIWDGLTLRCEAGTAVAILVDGDDDRRHNTLVALLTGFLAPKSGRVLTKTTPFTDLTPLELRGHRIGAILAVAPLRGDLSAAANLIYTMDASGRNFLKPIPVVAQDLLRAVGFGTTDDDTHDAAARVEDNAAVASADRSRTLVRDLDAVDAARVAVARAVATDPDIIVADEPTAALNDDDARTILDLLRAQVKTDTKTRTVIVVTADPDVASRFDDVIDVR